MVTKALVISERPNEYQGKKGWVKQIILTLLDQSPAPDSFINTFDHVCSEDDQEKYAGKLVGKIITFGVHNFEMWSGRIRCAGRIIETPLDVKK